ncbi:MAG: CDP-glycerol glycerophosphotransferase family protein [Patescibacteria group bacterium]
MNKTIFISVSTPILIRNFLLIPNGLLDILKKQKDTRIVLLVVDSAAEVVKKDFGDTNVIIEPVKVKWKRNLLQKLGIFFNTYLNLTPLAWLEATMGVRIDEKALRKKKKYPLFLKKFIANTFGKSKWVRKKLASKIDNFIFSERPYKDLFDKYKPLVIFVPDIFGPQGLNILREAKRQGVKSLGMTASWDHFPKRFEARKPDTLLVWNEILKKEAIELQDYEEKNIFVSGVPQYDLFAQKEHLLSREEFFKNINLDSGKKLISFFSSSKRAPDDGDIVDMILKWIKEKKFSYNAHMYIRPYPGVVSDHEKFDKFEGNKLVYIDWIEKKRLFGDGAHAWYPSLEGMIFFMNVLYHSDVIISTYSSVSVEASVFLKPAININFDGYKQRPFEQSIKRSKYKSHFMHVFETKGVWQVENQQELFDSIEKFLKNPDTNKENLIKLRDKMCWKIDGKASERIANKILEYIK